VRLKVVAIRSSISLSLMLALSISISGFLLSPPPLQGQDVPAELPTGKMLYEWHCMSCHGTGGWGDGPHARDLIVPPANFHSSMSRMASDEQMLMRIEFGVIMSPMHAWRGRLTEQEMQEIVAYIRFLAQRGR
jgi:mono/diheme cytochrome c family protein